MKTEQGKTIKQIADELGVSKQAIRKHIGKLPVTLVVTGANHVIHIKPRGEAILRTLVQTKSANLTGNLPVTDAVSDAVIHMLQAELEIKNEQIHELNVRLAESNAALVTAQQTAQTAQALHAGTMQKLLEARKPFKFPWGKSGDTTKNRTDRPIL